MKSLLAKAAIIVTCVCLTAGCVKRMHRQVTTPEQFRTVDRRSPFLKAHMRDGTLYLLSPWTIDSTTRIVTGRGEWLDVNRRSLQAGDFSLSVDSVALFETNVVRPSPSVGMLAVISGITAGVTVYCITDPKACFGSCPTFYVSDGTRELLQAEGFSASVAPSLEATDVDHLYRARVDGSEVTLRMVNEAMETHAVRTVNLLAVPRGVERRVLVDDEFEFWSANEPASPLTCRGPEGSCLESVRAFDQQERMSVADSADLATREIVQVSFPDVPGERFGLVLASRQSLLPTYLLYQAFAYMGTTVGTWMATLERADDETRQRTKGVAAALGGIEILVQDTVGRWIVAGEVVETGPLAADVKVVPLPGSVSPTQVRLRMAKGAWRLDYVAIAALGNRVQPLRIPPSAVRRDGAPAGDARDALLDPQRVLVTYPGDTYTITYRLPSGADHYELFLESRGYYLEWMREEWIAEENPLMVAALFHDPELTLKRLAPEFKRAEPGLEAAFWRSKYVRP